MQNDKATVFIESAIKKTAEMNPQETDGKWLEVVTVESGPFIKEWDLSKCWHWEDWPERETRFPNTTRLDVGIDAVAVRRGDGKHVAIQCKSRRLDDEGHGSPIHNNEIAKFAAASAADFWAERWVVTNGDNPLASGAIQSASMSEKPLKLVNITNDLNQQSQSSAASEENEYGTSPEKDDAIQTKSCMQDEAVANSVRILKEQEHSESGGLPLGEARGRIILPCGTGKTRISLRIVEELTPPGELSIVLCPSIALVSQIRREYLENAAVPLDVLAVCSDATAGYDPKKEGRRNATLDPTVDNSNVSASEVKGRVTTDAGEIAEWMRQATIDNGIKVLIGTYQSSGTVSEALLCAGVRARVLIADEAHRTAGLKRKNSKSAAANEEEKRLRDFTVCHDRGRFPATYRVYQTATPRIYDGKRATGNPNWIVRSMDDETTFGVELYRKSYLEAVRNRWLSDYRIIAMGINDPEAFETANILAKNTKSKGRGKLTTTDYMRGLAYALTMGGATQGESVDIRSCIAFMNTVDKSKNMAEDLQTGNVKEWVSRWLEENADGRAVSDYSLEHLDASSNAAARETAKGRLASADAKTPHGIINVGIFGEGTDSPSLSAVAFLEARKSPIDVVQAVGRAMRTAPDKELGYIVCPILIPPTADPEKWLSNSDSEEGWQELGQILLALRAHDQRIEENLEELLQLYIPKPPPVERTLVAVATGEGNRIQYGEVEGPPGAAQEAVEQTLKGKTRAESGIRRISETQADFQAQYSAKSTSELPRINEKPVDYRAVEITQVFTGKKNDDGSIELRADSVDRDKPDAGEARGVVNIQKTKAKARKMINSGEGGIRVQPGSHKKAPKTAKERAEENGQVMLKLSGLEEHGSAIKMNLLAKSGLSDNRVIRDLNILEGSVSEAAHHMRADGLLHAMNQHFGLDRLKKTDKKHADGCTVAALLMMNAAMLHQRISNGGWLSGISDLSIIKNDVNVVRKMSREWERIMRHDFRPVLEPALEAIYAVETTGKTAGLERAMHHIAAEAERIAETYADMGADHAGPLFNRVMGNQASDGAFFTRPVAASLAARLTLDVCGDPDWSDPRVWREHRTVDLACGSGTLLAAMLTDMKRRAAERGADLETLTQLQKVAVEDVIKGLDINPVSLQLAASQLTAGNHRVSYRRMGLHQMPYGPDKDNPRRMSVGTLELLGQKSIVNRGGELDLGDDAIGSQATWASADDTELEDAVDAARDARIVIMNPPFTNRANLGEKFPPETQSALRDRADLMERRLTQADPGLMEFADKNSIRPLFVGLADHCVQRSDGTLTMINPTIALTTPSGQRERLALAQRFHIHTVLTSHQPQNINMSQHTSINESIVVMRRHPIGPKPPTRFINLDVMPADDGAVDDLHRCLLECEEGLIENGWGEASYWPAELIEAGDWTPAIWRSPELAKATIQFASHPDLLAIEDLPDNIVRQSGRRVIENMERASQCHAGSTPILYGKGTDAQTTIEGQPDEYWIAQKGRESQTEHYLEWKSHLLITGGQRNNTARLTAVAANEKYIGGGWHPITGMSPEEAKATAVFINSTLGRLQVMRNAGRTIEFPIYRPAGIENVRIPDIKDERIRGILSECWERTRDIEVPQFRDGECEVRRLWDEAVAEAMGWDAAELTRFRLLLHQEPHVRGLGYGQYADEVDIEPADRDRFTELADLWENETVFLSNPDRITEHRAHREIVSMGESAVPLILQRMQAQGGHWFYALRAITGANPVKPDDRGKVAVMQESWLEWGKANGYA
ncbi:MAG: DEAD/DEAH box helicase family protein [Gemmatimonadota bacterium]|nr:DEAD/DEAH box helicase family protein [Gemmatimonadota bacterium]